MSYKWNFIKFSSEASWIYNVIFFGKKKNVLNKIIDHIENGQIFLFN